MGKRLKILAFYVLNKTRQTAFSHCHKSMNSAFRTGTAAVYIRGSTTVKGRAACRWPARSSVCRCKGKDYLAADRQAALKLPGNLSLA